MSRFSPITFMVAFTVAYAVGLWFNAPLFVYYPTPKLFHWGPTPVPNVGPGIAWYGLLAEAAIVAAVAAFLFPNTVADRLLRNYFWVIPIVAMAISVFLLRNFFLI